MEGGPQTDETHTVISTAPRDNEGNNGTACFRIKIEDFRSQFGHAVAFLDPSLAHSCIYRSFEFVTSYGSQFDGALSKERGR